MSVLLLKAIGEAIQDKIPDNNFTFEYWPYDLVIFNPSSKFPIYINIINNKVCIHSGSIKVDVSSVHDETLIEKIISMLKNCISSDTY